MEIPVQLLPVLLTFAIALQAWTVKMLFRMDRRLRELEIVLELNGLNLPKPPSKP